jgi:broad-specificity NMP kinase
MVVPACGHRSASHSQTPGPRVLVTGMSGTGKSSVVHRLREVGHHAVDIDEDGYLDESGEEPLWKEEPLRRVVEDSEGPLFLAGTAANQGSFYPHLDHIVLLSAPAAVVRERVRSRTNSPFGKRPGELDRIMADLENVEPLLRAGCDLELDTSGLESVEVTNALLRHVGLPTLPADEETNRLQA